jgi:hypothetical protein
MRKSTRHARARARACVRARTHLSACHPTRLRGVRQRRGGAQRQRCGRRRCGFAHSARLAARASPSRGARGQHRGRAAEAQRASRAPARPGAAAGVRYSSQTRDRGVVHVRSGVGARAFAVRPGQLRGCWRGEEEEEGEEEEGRGAGGGGSAAGAAARREGRQRRERRGTAAARGAPPRVRGAPTRAARARAAPRARCWQPTRQLA